MANASRGTKIDPSDLPTHLDENGEPVFASNGAGNKPRNSDAYDTTELRGISDFDTAMALAAEKFGSVDNASEHMGTGFSIVNNEAKDQLLGVPFIVMSMDFNEGDQGPFVSFLAVTKDNRKVIVNDGSTGIYRQLDEWFVRTGKAGGLFVEGGLRKSEYDKVLENGKVTHATTYYLNV